jgi:hypothetical protein
MRRPKGIQGLAESTARENCSGAAREKSLSSQGAGAERLIGQAVFPLALNKQVQNQI